MSTSYDEKVRREHLESVRKINDWTIPDHHLTTAQQKVRRDIDALGLPTYENPIVRHKVQIPLPYDETWMRAEWLVLQDVPFQGCCKYVHFTRSNRKLNVGIIVEARV
jgi:hypothetical protein